MPGIAGSSPSQLFCRTRRQNSKDVWKETHSVSSSRGAAQALQETDSHTAQMLATPNRWCPVTKVHLPAAFLQGFQLMAHPETQEPWWVPSALDPSQPVRPDSSEEEDCSNQVPGPVAYTLAREKMLRSFALASGKYRRGYAAFLRMSNSAELASTLTKAVWRQDMDTHLLELMRRRICERISYLAKLCSEQDRQYLLPYTSLEQLQSLHHLGCILLLDKEKGSVQDYGDMANAGLLAHHLPTLLGDEHAERLCTDSALLSGCSAIIVRGERTIPLQKQLWALQGYLS